MLHFNTYHSPEAAGVPGFQKGDAVFLATGSYQGERGVFLNLKDDDPKWADILEGNSEVRAHPVEWLAHSPLG
jgi:hypothetical protein